MDPLLYQAIGVGGEPLEKVSSFKYFGASFTATGQAFGEIKARINVARAAFNRLQPSLWSRLEISHRTKGCIYESVVTTILLYDCETWPLRIEDQLIFIFLYIGSERRRELHSGLVAL